MIRTLFALLLSLAACTANALDWPWQKPAATEPLAYCAGFTAGGLDSKLVSGVSRTELWLAWSYVIRSGAMPDLNETAAVTVASNEYRSGLEQFKTVADREASQSVLQQKEHACGLGRSGHEVTGW